MMSLSRLLVRTPNRALFYSSLVGALTTSLFSYWISFIAKEQSSSDIGSYTIAQYSVMAGFMLMAWKSSPQSNVLSDYRWLVVAAVAARVLLFDVTPYASNDVDRYLFDGRIAIEGFDPYRMSHDAPQLTQLRELWQPPVEHAKYVTLYPPLALGFFAVSAAAGVTNAVLVWKAILLIASLMTLWLMTKLLTRAKKLEHLALVALSPLLILETHVGLHLDALSTLAIVSALYCWQQGWIARAGIVIGLGTTIKILPLMLLLPLIFTLKYFKLAVILLMSTLLTIIGVYWLAISLGFHPVGSIEVFFEKWRFAAPLFVVLDTFLSGQQILIVMLAIATVICSFVAYFCWCYRENLAQNTLLLVGSLQLVIALPLILSPVTFPWYLMPLIPLTALYPNRYLIVWMLLMPLTYEVINQFICCHVWQPAQWPVWTIGLLQLAALIALIRYFIQYWPPLSAVTNKS